MHIEKGVLLFEITTTCNLHCSHCFGNKSTNNILTLPKIKQILEKITSYKVRDLILTGGEPFLRPDIFEIIQYAKRCGIENIAITTNGILFDSNNIIQKINENLDVIAQLYIGINGATSKTHNFIRGAGQFEKLMRILRKNEVRKLPIGIDVCVGKWNFHELYDFFDMAQKFSCLFFNFVPFIPLGVGKAIIDQVLSAEECKSMLEMVHEMKLTGEYFDLCFTPYAKVIDKDLTSCCNILSEFITLTAQGEIIPCLYMKEFNLGSFLNYELEELYSKPIAKYFLEPQKNKTKIKGYCNKCNHYELCGGGCKVVSYAIKGSIFETDPLCPFAEQGEKLF
ncbi:MAG: radical SAM protein [Candidatus Hermodarchaeota archaeon]